jgi:hypothetical protein
MRLLRERGMDWAVLGTLNENTAMQAAAAAVGFQVAWQRLWYARLLSAA